MNSIKTVILAMALCAIMSAPSLAQQRRISPHETISHRFSGHLVIIVYGRPYSTKPGTTDERRIWGGLVPWGEIWRTGADEATLMITQEPMVFGDQTVPAGCYTLWTLPQEDGTAKLIINKQIGQWGINPSNPKSVYDEANDVARVDLKKTDLPDDVTQFTMAIAPDPANRGGGLIELKWEKTEYSAPFTLGK